MNITKKSYTGIPYMGSQYTSPYSAGGSGSVRGGQINTFQGLLAALMARGLQMPDAQESTGAGGQEQITDFLEYFKENSGQGDVPNWANLEKAQEAFAAYQKAKGLGTTVQGIGDKAQDLGTTIAEGAPAVIGGAQDLGATIAGGTQDALKSNVSKNIQEDVGKGVTSALNSEALKKAKGGVTSLLNRAKDYAKPRR